MRRLYVPSPVDILSCIAKKHGGATQLTCENNRRMARVTCLKRRQARMCPKSSPTEHQDATAPKTTGWKDKMHKLDDKWNKFRPYVERLNGTIVPLQSHEEQERDRVVRATNESV